MSSQLSILEKISSITGELAVFKESGVLAVVRIEKITIESDMLSFTLKPQRGRRFGLETLKAFTVGSSFEYLDHSDGRYTSSIVSWLLETDPVKVTYLSNLIHGDASIDDIFSAFRKRQVFYDEDTAKVVNGLTRLKSHIKTRKILLTSDQGFKGQSWGGAGVMVISGDDETVKQYSHFEGAAVISEHAPQIGDLFRRVRRITAISSKYNYLSKLEFWADLAAAANSVKQDRNTAKLEEVCDQVIMKAIAFVTKAPCSH